MSICLVVYVFLAQGLAQSSADELAEIKMLVETESTRRKAAEEEITHLKRQLGKYTQAEVSFFFIKTYIASVFFHVCFWYIRVFVFTRQEGIWRL